MTGRDRPDVPTLDAEVVDRYLVRIGHAAVDAPTTAALRTLQDAHVRTVPFENLDIHLGWPLSLDLDDLAGKVIDRHRGGFCYELNGLFCALLVDVGTGASPRGPIRLDDAAQRVGHDWFRVREVGDRYDSDRYQDDAWVQGWSFEPSPQPLGAFAARCRYHERSPDSHFTHKPICTLVTEDGHLTLADRELIITDAQGRHEEVVDDPLEMLSDRFGIVVPRWPGS